MKLSEFQREIDDLYQWAHYGCSSGDCVIERHSEMHTNSGCRCQPQMFADRLLAICIKLDEYKRHEIWDKPGDN